MADDKKKKGHDANFISMLQKHEVDYWTARMGVSKKELDDIIKKVGNSVKKVRAYIDQNKLKEQ